MLCAALLSAMFSACSPLGEPPLQVNITGECDKFAVPVPAPPVKVDDDVRVDLAQHRAALAKANGRLAAVRNCDALVRARYAAGR